MEYAARRSFEVRGRVMIALTAKNVAMADSLSTSGVSGARHSLLTAVNIPHESSNHCTFMVGMIRVNSID